MGTEVRGWMRDGDERMREEERRKRESRPGPRKSIVQPRMVVVVKNCPLRLEKDEFLIK